MNGRLQQFIAAENISQAQFADSINVARASVSHILAGRNKPGFEFISNMARRYPALNIEWLITGQGKMYKESSHHPIFDDDDLLFHDNEIDTPQVPEQKSTPASSQNPEPVIDSELNETPLSRSMGDNASETITLNSAQDLPVTERKATKVIIFYNDGTFQEL